MLYTLNAVGCLNVRRPPESSTLPLSISRHFFCIMQTGNIFEDLRKYFEGFYVIFSAYYVSDTLEHLKFNHLRSQLVDCLMTPCWCSQCKNWCSYSICKRYANQPLILLHPNYISPRKICCSWNISIFFFFSFLFFFFPCIHACEQVVFAK